MHLSFLHSHHNEMTSMLKIIHTYIHTYIQFICIALDNTDIVIPTALNIDLQLKFFTVKD